MIEQEQYWVKPKRWLSNDESLNYTLNAKIESAKIDFEKIE